MEMILSVELCSQRNERGATNIAVSSSHLIVHGGAWRSGLELILCSQSFCPPCSFMVVKINWSSVDSPADRVPEYSHFLKNRKTLVQWQRTGLQLCFKEHKHPQELQAWCKDATSGIASPKGSGGQPMPRSATTEMKYFNLDPPGSKALWTYYLSSACIANQQNIMSL